MRAALFRRMAGKLHSKRPILRDGPDGPSQDELETGWQTGQNTEGVAGKRDLSRSRYPDPDPEPGKEIDYLPLLITFGILIVLVVIGIIFKDKLRPYWFRLKSMFKRGGTSTPSEATPPGLLPPGNPQQQPTRPRRILPRQPSRPRPKVQRKPKGADKEFSDVLKKLKDIGS